MKTTKVKCWKDYYYHPKDKSRDEIIITYPESTYGHDLISCLSCGQIYAIDIEKETYIGPPLKEKLIATNCIKCAQLLSKSSAPYPDLFLSKSGQVLKWKRENLIPNDADSIFIELPSLY